MLDRPRYGWCNIMVGTTKIGCASYLMDLPVYLLDAFNQYLSDKNRLNFCVEFDAEGYSFGLSEFDQTLYFVNNKRPEIEIKEIKSEKVGLRNCMSAKDILNILATELIGDIQSNIEDWVYWENDEELMERGESDDRRRLLQSKINELKEKING